MAILFKNLRPGDKFHSWVKACVWVKRDDESAEALHSKNVVPFGPDETVYLVEVTTKV